MGQQGGQCLKFQPGLGQCLSDSLEQLLQDAGMGQGQTGMGMGGGGGFSTSRSTMQNVGLYGQDPLVDQESRAGQGESEDANDVAAGGMHRNRNNRGQEGSAFRSTGAQSASGAGDAVVPLRYRHKVGEYFRRIADEVGNQ